MSDQPSPADKEPSSRRALPLGPTLIWLGIAAASAGLTFVLLRAAMLRNGTPSDETAERIQALIDEANRLIKTLDEKRNA